MAGNETKEDMSGVKQTSKMNDERSFLADFMKAAINGEGKSIQRRMIEYSTKHEIAPYSVLKDFKDGSKRTAMHFACQSVPNQNEEVDVVKLLLEQTKIIPRVQLEAIVGLEDVEGLTPLMLACQNMHPMTFERIKCILDIDSKTALAKSKAGATALHYAAAAGASKEVIDLVYEHGKAALSTFTLKGSTPLHWASSDAPPKNYTGTINALFELGADANAISEGGIPCLIVALASRNDAHAEILVKHGADRGVILGGGVTVYHMAADLDLKNTLKAMLDADIDAEDEESSISTKCLKMKNEKDETPLDLAAQRGHFECFKLLSGEQDDDKAKAAMVALQKEWNKKTKSQSADEKADNKPTSIAIDGEAEAKTAAAMLVANPPSVSVDDKQKAADFKAIGNGHFAKSEWEEAIAGYTNAIKLNPLDETYYSNRSACFLKVRKNNEALNDAVICRYLKPKWVKGCYRLSMARLALERFEDAAVAAWEGLNLDEGNPELETLVTKCIKKGRKEHLEKTKGAK